MRKTTVRERFSYWFDSVMARGTGALIALLGLGTLVAILIISAGVAVFGLYPTALPDGYADLSLPELLWGSLTRMLSSGAFREDEGWGFRIAMLVATVVGLVIVASLIGIISNAFDRRVLELRRGRSRVLESGHLLVIGWNATVLPMIGEFAAAARDGRRSTVVVLSRRDKVELEEEVRAHFGRLRGLRLIVRTGSPIQPADLALGSPETARSIVVVSPEAAARPDIEVIKTVVVLMRQLEESDSGAAVFAELRREESLEAAHLAGGDRARWIVSEQIVALLTVHSVRDRGISRVSRDLLDFAGDEFHLIPAAPVAGLDYGTAQRHFPRATLVGYRRDGRAVLNPPASTALTAQDSLFVVAANAGATLTAPPAPVDESIIRSDRRVAPSPTRTLILGSHSGLDALVDALVDYFPARSTIHVVSAEEKADAVLRSGVTVEHGDTTSRQVIDALGIEQYDHIVVLPYRDSMGEQEADAHTFITLLHVRDRRARAGIDVAIVAEVLDDRNREIVAVVDDGDVIVSGLLVSRLLAQVVTTPELTDVFAELFGPAGSETHLRAVEEYVSVAGPVWPATLVEAAARREETFVGIVSAQGRRVQLNPPKHTALALEPGDRLIVLAAG